MPAVMSFPTPFASIKDMTIDRALPLCPRLC